MAAAELGDHARETLGLEPLEPYDFRNVLVDDEDDWEDDEDRADFPSGAHRPLGET